MAEPSRAVRAQGVSKSILEQSEMDLTNLRIGKQRLVSKKKRLSKLKKTILEDREYRAPGSVLPLGGDNAQPRPVGLVAAPAVVEPFLPSWCMEEEEASDGQKVEEQEEKEEKEEKEESDLRDEPDEPDEAEEPDDPVDEKEREEKARDALMAMSISETLQRLQATKAAPGGAKGAKATTADLEVRHYVHQELSDELDEKVKFVLGELVRFQERAKEQNAMKYAKLKRFCVGLREAKRAINRKKCKGLVVAPNLEVSTLEGGLDDTVEELIELARENEVPVIFALSRNRIGKAMGKSIRLSIVALHSVDGVHQQFKELVKLAEELRRRWVLRQMSHATSEFAEEALKRAEEKAARDAQRRAEKERQAELKAAEELRLHEQRQRIKAEKAAAKARKVAEQKEDAERRREEREAAAKEREAEKAREEQETEALRVQERLAEQERIRKEEEAAKEAERQRRAAARKAEEERQKRMAEAAAKAQAVAPAEEESDAESSGSDLPLGFNSNLF
eukprot:s481_g16.t1